MKLRAAAGFVFALFAFASVTRTAHAQTIAAALTEADRRYADLDYRGAAELAQRVGHAEEATPAQRAHAWERVGLSWLILGQRALAKEAFAQLFGLDDTRAVDDPSLSPRQHQFIEDVRTEVKRQKPAVAPEPEVTPAPETPPAVPIASPPKKPLYTRWYLWTPIAVVVVGAGLGLGLGLGLRNAGPTGSLPPGTVTLAVHF